ncbi:MAG: glutamate synthase large subunit [Planctomycetota bacterium]|nr:glutamate synthase large subunit [Planctomycetota bacterium]
MEKNGLYDPANEHDACGVGFVARLDGAANHEVVESALTVLCNLAHRGASGADADSGDGAGILSTVPDRFFRSAVQFDIPGAGDYAIGVVFLPSGGRELAAARDEVERTAADEGWTWLGWREAPVNPGSLGKIARASMPTVRQFFLAPPASVAEADGEARERALYVLRKVMEKRVVGATGGKDFYVASLSFRVVVYKGMMSAAQVAAFYPDLTHPEFVSPFAIVHQRYSTNTFPSWRLAQPFRCLAHNGEINTIKGNRNWLRAREPGMRSPLFGDDLKKVFPVLEEGASDSASLDNALELLHHGGREIQHAMAMLIPQAWDAKYPMGPDMRGFFEYHSGLMEPWDGPAAVVFTDGLAVGACLDRNGLRPARYSLTRDGLIVFASEAGVLQLDPAEVVEKGALRPGQMLLVDPKAGRVLGDAEIKSRLARRRPYRRWVVENRIDIHGFFGALDELSPDVGELPFRQRLFGYTRDDAEIVLDAMASRGVEPSGSMGADTPLSVLSDRPQLLFDYFRQQFAQITNPPIDPIREDLVMSLMTFIGNDPNILADEPGQARLLKLLHPVFSADDMRRLRDNRLADFRVVTLDAVFAVPASGQARGENLEKALDRLETDAERAARSGARLIIVSDRKADAAHPPIPSLLAASAVNRRLIDAGLRIGVGLIAETGEARDVNHLALLLGVGASAVSPWLAFDTVADLALRGDLSVDVPATAAVENYVHALKKGLLKIMSKMGVSTLRSYRGAQVFEAVGVGRGVMDRYFPGIASRVGGIGLQEIEADALLRLQVAAPYASGAGRDPGDGRRDDPTWSTNLPMPLPVGGMYRYRKDGERHLWTPETITLLQKAVRGNDAEAYRQYAARINDQAGRLFTLRGMLRFKEGRRFSLDEVEPSEAIMKRFVTGAMSFGSLSREAHEALAVALNRIGSNSNSGEGGEDPARYEPLPDGDSVLSGTKQVASGRFGVTLEYLVNARELQIKIAQGAKPGEGGQLPGHKVNDVIATVRHSTPGVTLISPPPHHDIYSIEDIAQLIHDLRSANDAARISVKLVAETGVGTIAAGVAKANADLILISGHDGGTGASPLSSIHRAGTPWELGLAETQQTLALNNLRGRVRLQADGQMKTGRDVAVAALLGADEFGFATAPLVTLGCIMMRKCHTNACPVGVATQDPEMRKRFRGKPEHVINYFRFVAEELREIMAAMGFRTVDAMVGRADRLEVDPALRTGKAKNLDWRDVLIMFESTPMSSPSVSTDSVADPELDLRLLPGIREAIDNLGTVKKARSAVLNTDRTVGTRISSEIVRRHGGAGLPADSVILELEGAAGQSFGAFAAPGLTIVLSGEANDYVGKGLSGGKLIVKPPKGAGFDPSESVMIGNVALYGATAGELYVNGRAGERFAVRNSGARAVTEGVGDHGCEYMTGGRVAVLGRTGVNFAAGMSGGLAYVYDDDGFFDNRCNLEMIDLDVLDAEDEAELRSMIEDHVRHTESGLGRRLLDDWDVERAKFVKVFPMEYRRALGRMSKADEETPRRDRELN